MNPLDPTSRKASTLPNPQQLGLRSFVMMDRLPEGCIAFPILNDDSSPHLRPGDIAVIDTTDTTPARGELFVIEWGRSSLNGPRRYVVELWTRELQNSGGPFTGWFAGAYARPKSHEEVMQRRNRSGLIRCYVDGPYPDQGAANGDYLPSLLVGKVVGLLEPANADRLLT